jgi:hypothetical protein
MATMGVSWKMLETIGVNPERLDLEWASSSEAPRFVQLVTRFTERMKELGPLGSSEGKDWGVLKFKLEAALQTTQSMRLRMAFGKLAKEIRVEGAYKPESIQEKIAEKLGDIVKSEVTRSEILLRLEEKSPISSEELSSNIGLPLSEVEGELEGLSKKKLAEYKDGVWAVRRDLSVQ